MTLNYSMRSNWGHVLRQVRRLVSVGIVPAAIALIGSSSAFAASPALFSVVPAASVTADSKAAHNTRIDQIKLEATTGSVTVVRIDLSALSAASTQIGLADGKMRDFARARVETRSPTSYTWVGTLPGVEGRATLVVNDGNITGTIRNESELYRVEPLGNGLHALIKVDQSRFPADHPPSFTETEKNAAPLSKTSSASAVTHDGPVQINVLVAYTTAVGQKVPDINAFTQLAIDETNQSYLNSGINIHLNKVDSFEVVYSETGKSFDSVLADFRVNETVTNRRDASKADVAMMLINHDQYCGVANAIMGDANNSFAVVHYTCATGYYSFGHELGHLQGARHDTANDSTKTPFAYGHGYQSTNSSPKWRTVMAYDCKDGCNRLQYWSNPDISYNGLAMGTPGSNNNARVLNETATIMAGFRNRAVPVACARENETCSFTGVRSVSYGANGVFTTKVANGSIACNASTFGVALDGVAKSCFASKDAFAFCAAENDRCNFSGSKTVAYGANGKFVTKVLTRRVKCKSREFGDPLPGVAKACYIK